MYLKNGLRLRLTHGPSPVVLALCPESMHIAQELLRRVRDFIQRRNAESDDAAVFPSDSRSASTVALSARSPSLSGAAPGGSSPIRDGGVVVWCLRSGQREWRRSTWSITDQAILHEGGVLPLSEVRSVCQGGKLLPLAPPVRAAVALCTFVLSLQGCDLFCCTQRPGDRDDILAKLRGAMLRARLEASMVSPATSRATGAGSLSPLGVAIPGCPSPLHPSGLRKPSSATRARPTAFSP
jgi:hypothetical protein